MPTGENDTSPKGLPKGAEGEAEGFVQATGGTVAQTPFKPAVSPIEFEAPPAPDEAEEDERPEDIATPDLELDGLGNLAEFLFSETERPDEDINAPAADVPQNLDSPAGPPTIFREMLHDPNVSAQTKSLIELVTRVRMLAGYRNRQIPSAPTPYEPPLPR